MTKAMENSKKNNSKTTRAAKVTPMITEARPHKSQAKDALKSAEAQVIQLSHQLTQANEVIGQLRNQAAMHNKGFRLECLKLAVGRASSDTDLFELTREFEEFVNSAGNPSDHDKLDPAEKRSATEKK